MERDEDNCIMQGYWTCRLGRFVVVLAAAAAAAVFDIEIVFEMDIAYTAVVAAGFAESVVIGSCTDL